MPRLAHQMQEALSAFADMKTPPALIGGLALAVHHVVRGTRDIDFLVDAEDSDRLHGIILAMGYDCVHRSEDAANYLRGDEGLDLLYAHRPESMQLLLDAPEHVTGMGRLRVVSADGLIGFKLQAHVNDPRRLRDVDDIRELLRTNRDSLDLQQVRRYFELFNREAMLDDILAGLGI